MCICTSYITAVSFNKLLSSKEILLFDVCYCETQNVFIKNANGQPNCQHRLLVWLYNCSLLTKMFMGIFMSTTDAQLPPLQSAMVNSKQT